MALTVIEADKRQNVGPSKPTSTPGGVRVTRKDNAPKPAKK